MIENSLEGFIAVRDILLLAPAEEIVTMFNTEELQDYLLENINLLLNFDSRCLFLKKDMYEKLLLIVNNGRFKTENVNRLTKINYAIIKINTEKCHNNSMEEMNSYILQQCKLRLGKRLTLEYMYDYKLLKDHYDLVDFEILDGCYFYSEIGLFDNYIDKYKKIKMENKGAVRESAKLFLDFTRMET